MLFNTYLDAVIRVALKNHPNKGIRIEYSHNAPLMHNSRHKLEEAITVQSLAYADDHERQHQRPGMPCHFNR